MDNELRIIGYDSLEHNLFSPYPLLLVFCVCEQLPDVRFRLSDVFVEDLWAIDDLWFPGVQHLADLSRHEGFTAAWRSVQQDSLHVFTTWRQEQVQGETK